MNPMNWISATGFIPCAAMPIDTPAIIDSASGTIKIGRECLLANHVEIDYSGGVTLEDHVWISDGAMIMPSVRYIKKNSIIGAGAIVTKDVPENVVVAGNPAKIIRGVES